MAQASAGPGSAEGGPLAAERVAFLGRLETVGRDEAEGLVRRLGGEPCRRVSRDTTLLVVAERGSRADLADRRLAAAGIGRDRCRVLSESEFCRLAGVPSAEDLRSRYHPLSRVRSRYPTLRRDRIRYLEKWGLVRPAAVTRSERWYAFDSLAVLVSVHERLEAGTPLRAIVSALRTGRQEQLSLDLAPRARGATVLPFRHPSGSEEAEAWFLEGYEQERLPGGEEAAAAAYTRALEIDPELVPALINLANLHYSRNELDRARELYLRAAAGGGDAFFQIPFNLGNIAHDLEAYTEARRLYERAVRLAPDYADAHFYLALTLEKLGLSAEARPHWRAYRMLEPRGEWARLAREMERGD
jgi:tetratricopeptide (TPR) repeat protein